MSSALLSALTLGTAHSKNRDQQNRNRSIDQVPWKKSEFSITEAVCV
jgi:hypothetical protein